MNIGYTFAATVIGLGLLIGASAFTEGRAEPTHHHHQYDHEKRLHTSRDDLMNQCTALQLQYVSAASTQHTATSDRLRNEGIELCRAGSRLIGVDKLAQALNEIGVTPDID